MWYNQRMERKEETGLPPYQVRLPVFEGPLDLLLYLIEKRELDITTVSLAAVADQYLEYIALLPSLDAGFLADFLVIAARLLLIKSQALLPQPPAEVAEPEEDVGEALARQLREYKRFKEVAQALREREEQDWHSYARLAPPPMELPFHLEGVTLDDLTAALRRALTVLPTTVPPAIPPIVFSITDKIALIQDVVGREGRASFNRLLATATCRLEAIVTFLALLELIKQGWADVRQEQLFGEIVILAAAQTVER